MMVSTLLVKDGGLPHFCACYAAVRNEDERVSEKFQKKLKFPMLTGPAVYIIRNFTGMGTGREEFSYAQGV